MKVLVVTVGTSPLPALLSVLTRISPDCPEELRLEVSDRVILAHSGDGQQPYPELYFQMLPGLSWERIGSFPKGQTVELFQQAGSVRFAGLLQVALRKVCPQLAVDLFSIGTLESDIAAIRERFDQLPTLWPQVDSWMLDYTGGTSAMTAAAVDWHLHLPSGQGGRTYVDYTSNQMLHTNRRPPNPGAEPCQHPVSIRTGPLFSIELVAFIHGFYLVPNTTRTPGSDHEDAVAAAVEGIASRHGGEITRNGGRCCERLLDRGFRDRLSEPHHPDWEVMNGYFAYPLGTTESASEFDTILRWGSRIFIVEAKTSARWMQIHTGWRARASSLVFGPLTASLFVYATDRSGGENHPYTAALLDQVTGRRMFEADVTDLSDSGFHGTFFPPPRSGSDQKPPRPSTEEFPAGVLVTGVGHQSLAAVTAVDTSLPKPGAAVIVLFSQQASTETRKAVVELVRDRAPGSAVTASTTLLGDEVGLAARVGSYLRAATGPVVLDLTAGTKAMTAALVRARATAAPDTALSSAQLIVRDPRTRHISRLPADFSTPPAPACLPWDQILNGYASPIDPETLTTKNPRLLHLARVIASRGDQQVTHWWRPGQWPLLPPSSIYLALSIGDRLILLVDPQVHQPSPDADTATLKEAQRKVLHLAIQADVAAAFQFGEAVVTVVINPWHGQLARRLSASSSRDKPWWTRRLASGARPGLEIDLVTLTQTATPTLPAAPQWRTERETWRQLSTVRTVLTPWLRGDT